MADRIEGVFNYLGRGWGTDVDKVRQVLDLQATMDMYVRSAQRLKRTKDFGEILDAALEAAEGVDEGEEPGADEM